MDLLAICKQYNSEHPEYDSFGLRADDRIFGIGDIVPNSYAWDDGEKSEDILDGVSTIWLWQEWAGNVDLEKFNESAIDTIKIYPYDHIYIVASSSHNEGNDRDEWIMPEAIVVGIVK